MEALLKNAMIAWNPMQAVRERFKAGTLSVGSVIPTYVAVVIASNLVRLAADKFFSKSLDFGATKLGVNLGSVTDHPLTTQFPQQVLPAVGAIVPALIVWVLPERLFHPVGRSAAVAATFIVMAAWAFYSASFDTAAGFFGGGVAANDPMLGVQIYSWSSSLAGILSTACLIWFWFRILLKELQLKGGAVTLITAFYWISLVLLVVALMALFGA